MPVCPQNTAAATGEERIAAKQIRFAIINHMTECMPRHCHDLKCQPAAGDSVIIPHAVICAFRLGFRARKPAGGDNVKTISAVPPV